MPFGEMQCELEAIVIYRIWHEILPPLWDMSQYVGDRYFCGKIGNCG